MQVATCYTYTVKTHPLWVLKSGVVIYSVRRQDCIVPLLSLKLTSASLETPPATGAPLVSAQLPHRPGQILEHLAAVLVWAHMPLTVPRLLHTARCLELEQ